MNSYTPRNQRNPQNQSRRKKRRLRRRLQTYAARVLTVAVIISAGMLVYGFARKDPDTAHAEGDLNNLALVNYTEPVKNLEPVTSLYHDAEVVAGVEALLHKNPTGEMEKIAYNIDAYPREILELLLKNEETAAFVAGYPENITKYYDAGWIDVSRDVIAGEMPLFLQWDTRWGYGEYGTGNMGLNGCGPTSLSMVLVALTGDTSLNPLVVANYSDEQNMVTETNASTWDLFTTGAEHFGLSVREIPRHDETIRNTLRNGTPIIVSVDEGDFTTGGHILVLRGVTEDGKILVNDPNSPQNSEKSWDIDIFLEQAKNFWAYEVA